ncbi:unnamed protein product [Phaedon cochleariae]|uniref:Pre-C2HC domain-containing protein n=1 Tax=Phaedon cochleariae TaxID=80249 RepID=A0A9N9SJR3_PHACE|nr:unnamed protein product [Phaedon cochleariae]
MVQIFSSTVNFSQCNKPPRLIKDGLTEIVLKLKEGDENPVALQTETTTQETPQEINQETDDSSDEEVTRKKTTDRKKASEKNANKPTGQTIQPKPSTSNVQSTQTTKNEKPPPIIFDGILKDRREIIPMIKTLTTKPFHFKYGGDSTMLYTESIEDFENVKRKLREDEVPYYTYSLKKEKTHAFVLRGLDFEPEPSEILEEMESNYGIKAKEVYRLNTRFRPLYLHLPRLRTNKKKQPHVIVAKEVVINVWYSKQEHDEKNIRPPI